MTGRDAGRYRYREAPAHKIAEPIDPHEAEIRH